MARSDMGAIDAMAASVRVQRHSGEGDFSYRARVTYTCARAWVWAACMDDGAGGLQGVTKQAINARLKRWLLSLDEIYPGTADWYGLTEGKLRVVYERMLDVDDITESGLTGRFIAHRPALVRIDREAALIVGAFDLADSTLEVSGTRVGLTVTTGLCTLVPSTGESPRRVVPFWEADPATMEWSRATDVGEVEYVDLASRRWGLRNAESWQNAPSWYEGMTLARVRAAGSGPDIYYVARRTGRSVLFSEVGWDRAAELWLHLRSVSGHGIVARALAIDNHHMRLEGIPLPMLSGTQGRYVDALTWPVNGIGEWYVRVIRREALPAVKGLLERCDVGLKEV